MVLASGLDMSQYAFAAGKAGRGRAPAAASAAR
jgi:hypothetical protein